MKEVQKIAQRLLILLMDIGVFTCHIVRKIILPNRRRKGNILSSLLTFFVGLLERIVSFEKSILQRPVVFTHKYVKKGLIIAAGFLFLLSSFEWTIGSSVNASGDASPAVVACQQTAAQEKSTTPARAVSPWHGTPPFIDPAGMWVASGFFDPPPNLFPEGLVTARRWLRLGVFRI